MARRLRWLVPATLGALALAAWEIPLAFGGRPDLEVMKRSPQFRDGRFQNLAPPVPQDVNSGGSLLREMLFGGQRRKPAGPIPLVPPAPDHPQDGLHVTWYGHSSSLVEIEGRRVLIDPVWAKRASPSRLVGPKRMHEPPLALEELPRLDVIIVSHDHYDHLDAAAIRTLTRTQQAPFVVPLGVGAHLRRWKVPVERIIELDWHERTEIAGVGITAADAQHFSGRAFTRNNTLWASWVIATANRRVFYTGDSGYFGAYKEIGEKYGPFDASLVQIGAYHPSWPDIHMTPEEGVAAHLDVRGGVLVPVHWATFRLALHAWNEPAERVWREAKAHDLTLAVPRPGERIDLDNVPAIDPWWQAL
ncbi:L-ascorbate metabolism protein UlaG (beta-lactamase superfamily) [Amycolatopsis bartoniae]|uniref:Zn-dependent hydrolase n=1 Tax=Amycolatopsis bartoniae TaxID=941986 RepID=A0A8H9ITY4_9PSEU|nr:MBL fold metallo-hydrolase [Amycolatopsis bartoniae]MBB2933484.1 L-ascorbate metabolism protein UlaG (beta-lactamase superfamily) [Amycolatopsis bartoniae]TVT07587.1 MBL fold metallo-hydrolase [Amycolatopsis bartoniae]GHF59808.1 Zn-dependent hydrolase [Amycolatopsis bartoniae]